MHRGDGQARIHVDRVRIRARGARQIRFHHAYIESPLGFWLSGQAPLKCIAPDSFCLFAGIEMIKGRQLRPTIVTDTDNQFAGILTERDFLKIPLERGAASATTVAELTTPASRVAVPDEHTSMWECIRTMKEGDYHTIPVLEEGEVRRVVSMRNICQELSFTLNKRLLMPVIGDSDVTVGDLLQDVPTPYSQDMSGALPKSASVAEAVERMRSENHGAVLVLGETVAGGGPHVGLFTEREYLYSVLPLLRRGFAAGRAAE